MRNETEIFPLQVFTPAETATYIRARCLGETFHKLPITGPKGRVRMTAMDWRHQAACRDIDPEIFFPIGATGPALAQIQAAVAICGTCNVQRDCLEWALETGQDAGIWGGTTEEERREIRRGARQRVAV